MSWAENIAHQVFDPRAIASNLFDWFKENQQDALAWANEGADGVLQPVVDFFLNRQSVTRFPALRLNRIAYESETQEDFVETQIALQYEILLVHGQQNWLAENAPKYAMAFESMAKNLPKTRFEKGSKIIFDSGLLLSIETTFDFLRGDGSQFMQAFTTQINWLCDFANITE